MEPKCGWTGLCCGSCEHIDSVSNAAASLVRWGGGGGGGEEEEEGKPAFCLGIPPLWVVAGSGGVRRGWGGAGRSVLTFAIPGRLAISQHRLEA